MNNKQNNTNRSMLDTSRAKTGGNYEEFINRTRGQNIKDQNDDNSLRSEIQGKYTNNNNFMPSGLTPNSSGWFNLPGESGSGGFGRVGADYSTAKEGYGKFAETGGVNRGDFEPALGSYKNFMNNGGLGESEADALRTRATAGVPAFYNNYKNALARRSNVQGGYSPGYDSQMAEIGKDSARGAFNASRQVEGDIVDKRLQGRQFGTAGFGNLMSGITGMEQSGKLAGLGGLKGIGDSEMSASSANAGLDEQRAGRNQQMQQFLMDMYSSGGKTNAVGLQGLYNSAPGASGQSGNQLLSGMGGFGNSELSNIMARLGIKDKNWMDLIPGLVGAGGAIASGFGGGGGR